MDRQEATEWLEGKRSMCNILSSEDPNLWQVRIAQADAAMMEQAYWTLKAHKEGLWTQCIESIVKNGGRNE